MIIEVTGTSTWNKGAELMLVAIKQYFEKTHPEVHLAVDRWFGSYEERAHYGLWLKEDFRKWGRARLSMELMPPMLRQKLGIVREHEVRVILDASGFAFGDQHPAARTLQFAAQVEAAKKAGKKVMLLPQALGPFENPAIREGFRRIAAATDLIFARDAVSLAHAQEAAKGQGQILQAPDFTNLVKPVLRMRSEDSRRVCFVPNERMIEKAASAKEAEAYVQFIRRGIALVLEQGMEPALLVHSRPDQELARRILDQFGKPVEVIEEHDPVEIKRILGESRLVVASRFHALVSALSQAVPAIGTSWSHKYEMLFEDYGCRSLLMDSDLEKVSWPELMERAFSEQLREQIREKGAHLREDALNMWQKVEEVLADVHT